MISQPTVFILGAGASNPYGFPTASELRTQILNSLLNPDSEDFKALLKRSYTQEKIIDFAESFLNSNRPSIDFFLENRIEFNGIGRSAIVQQLVKCEKERIFVNHDWYQHLWNGKMGVPFNELTNLKVAFVTFNYDRSLEHFLFTSIKAAHNKTDEQVKEIMDKIPVIHVYGKLGSLKWQSNDPEQVRPFVDDSIVKAANQIKIVSDSTGNTPEFREAHEYITKAEKIFFLGFGYHNENMQRLNISFPPTGKFIGGTGFGLTNAQQQSLVTKYPGLQLGNEHWDISKYLRNETQFINLG